MINDILKQRQEEGKGKVHFLWIQSHMRRKGKLNESHTKQDIRAGETANNKAQHETQIPIPADMWNIKDEAGNRTHLRIRKTAEANMKAQNLFRDFLEEIDDKGNKTQQELKGITKVVQGKQKPAREMWKKPMEGTCRGKLGYLMRVRQNRLDLNERLCKMDIIKNEECKACKLRYPEKAKTEAAVRLRMDVSMGNFLNCCGELCFVPPALIACLASLVCLISVIAQLS